MRHRKLDVSENVNDSVAVMTLIDQSAQLPVQMAPNLVRELCWLEGGEVFSVPKLFLT